MNLDTSEDRPPPTPLASLRRYLRPRTPRERCEICGEGLAPEHSHLVEATTGKLACACEPCAILFGNQGEARYRRVPRDVRFLADFRLSDVAWAELAIPINLAFLLQSTRAGGVVALYPSPGGPIEAALESEAWESLAEENPVLRGFEPDVECLLVNRAGGTSECYRVGLDECYRLVGLVRAHWKGISGGSEVWDEIGRFFAGLKERGS